MATNLQQTLTDPGYRNWVKAGLSLKCAKNGIQNFVGDRVQTFQQNELDNICKNHGLPIGTVCNVCTTHNVLICPTTGICKRQGCNYHDNSDPFKKTKPCPNGICDKVRLKIFKNHRFKGPSWRNTNARCWYSNSWEWGKCYLPPDGYNQVLSASETDFTGLISVIINHKGFELTLDENLSSQNNIFCKAREIRNEILHTSSFQLSDAELNTYIDILIKMLSDQKYLAADQDAQDAIAKLNQIKNGSLAVTPEDETKLREDALRAIDEKKEEVIQEIVTVGSQQVTTIDEKKEDVIQEIVTEGGQQVKNILTEGSQQITTIDEKKEDVIQEIVTVGGQQVKNILTEGSQQVTTIDEKKEDVIQEIVTVGGQQVKNILTEGSQQVTTIDEKKEDVIQEIVTVGSQQITTIDEKKEDVIQEIVTVGSQQITTIDEKKEDVIQEIVTVGSQQVKNILTEGSQQVKNIEEKKDEVIKEMKREVNSQERKKEEYIKKKQNLQSDLIQQYLDDKLKIPISPIIPDEEANIIELYVAPHMTQVDPKMSKIGKSQVKQIKSYKDIFYKNTKQCKKIYITGNAGTGKTTLCQKMIFTWCNAHSKHKLPEDQISEEVPQLSEDEKVMLEFQFLFHISLRHAGSDSNIDDMIKHQVLHDPDYQEILPTLLHKEKCLVVLDGLDEWTKPECSCQISTEVNKGLPDRQIMSKCTILTTTRSWKLEHLRLKTSEVDQQIELMGLDDKSSHSLIEKVLTILNTNQSGHKSAKDFEEELKKNNVKEFRAIPVILKQLVCLWHDGKPLGETRCIIYSNMINLLFQMAGERVANNQEFAKLNKEWTEPQIELPKCFEDKMKCQEFRPLLHSLGRLSFETLFSQNQEESLVFEHSTADMYGMSKTKIDFYLKIGILSQSKVMGGCTTQMKNLSFLHKTFQEYLAAFYISTKPLDQVAEKIFSICNSAGMVANMGNVFIFISGMNPETASKLSNHISDVVSQDSYTQKYRQSINGESKQLQDVQSMVVACVKESSDSGYIDTRFQLQDVFINDGTSQYLENLLRTNTNNIKSVYLDTSSLPIELQKILLQVETLHKLVIEKSRKVSVHVIYNLVIKSKKSLQCLYLNSGGHDLAHGAYLILQPKRLGLFTDMSELPGKYFPYMLHTTTNMKELCLIDIKMSPYQLECLMSFLSNAKQMRIIQLSNIVLSDNHFHSYKLDLSHLQHLQWLCLKDLFVKEVKVNTSVLQRIQIGIQYPGVMSTVLERIQHAPQMQELTTGTPYLQYPPDAIDALISTLPTLVYLKDIDLYSIDFGESELKLSSAMKNLETIFLWRVTMTRTSFCGFVDSIPDTRHSLHVDIVACSIKPSKETVDALNHIKSNQRFLVTSCSCNNGAFETYFYTVDAKEELEECTTVYKRNFGHAVVRSSENILHNLLQMASTIFDENRYMLDSDDEVSDNEDSDDDYEVEQEETDKNH